MLAVASVTDIIPKTIATAVDALTFKGVLADCMV